MLDVNETMGSFGCFLVLQLPLALAVCSSPMTAWSDSPESQAMYRLYNPYSGEHFYTAEASERNDVAAAGWTYEGVGWMAPGSGDPVYRLYNPYVGEHHYTLDAGERDALVGIGWADEGVSWYSDPGKSVPLYREYNPNQFSCNHNYTTSKEEHDYLVGVGWRDEGIGWYALDAEPVDPYPLSADDVELLKLSGWWQVMREGGVRVYHFTGDDLYYYRATNSDRTGWNLDDPTISVKLVSHHKVSLTYVENVYVERAASLVNGHGPGYHVSAAGLGSSYYLFEDDLDVLYDSSGTTMCFGRISPNAVLLEAAEQYEN